jgi:hypothetical protein
VQGWLLSLWSQLTSTKHATTTPSACNQLSNSERVVPVTLRTSTVAILRSGRLTSPRVRFASARPPSKTPHQ